MNTVYFTGNVGKDPEVRTVKGTDVCNFNVAVKQGFGRDAPTAWYRVAVWGQQASFMKDNISKGSKVAVCGQLEIGEYEGNPQYNVRAFDVDPFCGGGNRDSGQRDSGSRDDSRSSGQSRGGGNGGASPFDADLDDDVPFLSADPRHELRKRAVL